jgi:hypothetical protein
MCERARRNESVWTREREREKMNYKRRYLLILSQYCPHYRSDVEKNFVCFVLIHLIHTFKVHIIIIIVVVSIVVGEKRKTIGGEDQITKLTH